MRMRYTSVQIMGYVLIDSSSGKLVMHDKSVEGIINSDLSKILVLKLNLLILPSLFLIHTCQL